MSRTLYICYFGVREPLVQTQVLPYLREIIKGGVEVSLLTFEPRRAAEDIREFSGIRQKLAEDGIKWDWLAYHKRPSAVATAWDILRGAIYIRRRIGRFDVLHGRVHVPTLMAAIARKFSLKKPKILFDIRGFMPEEYTDAGIWPEGGWLYRTAKAIEKWLMHEADAFVVLTEKAREILFPESRETGRDQKGRPVEVIPCCVDLSRFASANEENRTLTRQQLGINDRRVMVYVGSFGGWYLTKETLEMFAAFREKYKDAFAMILTQSNAADIENLLLAQGYGKGDYFVGRVGAETVPLYLCAADVAVSFIKSCYSKQSSSPTKIAEYLACGLPIIANKGVGDVDLLIEKNGVGVIVDQFEVQAYLDALDEIERLGEVSAKCREVAKEEFDLILVGGVRYRRIYGV
jgi:glycosyltransferase involved in cell wall biosynthesis